MQRDADAVALMVCLHTSRRPIPSDPTEDLETP